MGAEPGVVKVLIDNGSPSVLIDVGLAAMLVLRRRKLQSPRDGVVLAD